jgi:DNA ligase-associated metallophosphoesterase
MVPLSFANMNFFALADHALFWPEEKALLVADLHLEKASWYARHGQMLPPYDSRGNVERLAALVQQYDARTVYSLGDNYHDSAGEARLEPEAAQMLQVLTARTRWIWITGNHDRALSALHGGDIAAAARLGHVLLCHEPETDDPAPQICGHFHPKLRLNHRGRNVARRCYTASEKLLIMPSFGNLTGGLDVDHEAIAQAHQGQPYRALLPVRDQLAAFDVADMAKNIGKGKAGKAVKTVKMAAENG